MRASDLYRGVTRLTAAIERAATISVGTMIQFLLRNRACPSACTSRSPDSNTAAGLFTTGRAAMESSYADLPERADLPKANLEAPGATGLANTRWTKDRYLSGRQNVKRIAHSCRRHDSTQSWPTTLY